MAKFNVSEFFGIAPKIPPRYLKEGFAQTAINCEAIGNSLKPLKGLGATIKTLATTATKTIYKFGQDNTAENEHWFSWDSDVDVCRSQIAGDTNEWTFYTGDGAPKATYAGIALGAGKLPVASIPLGLPAPDTAPTVAAEDYVPDTEPATIYLSSAVLQNLTTEYGLKVSLDNEASYTDVPLANKTAATVAAALDAVSGISAIVEGGGVEITTDAGGRDVTLSIKTSDDNFAGDAAGGGDAGPAEVELNYGHIQDMGAYALADRGGLGVSLSFRNHPEDGPYTDAFQISNYKGPINQAVIINWLSGNPNLTAYARGSAVVLRSTSVGLNARARFYFLEEGNYNSYQTAEGAGTNAGPAVLVIPPSVRLNLNTLDDIFVTVNGGAEQRVELQGTTAAAVAGSLSAVSGITATHDGINVTMTTSLTGASASISYRYRTTRANIISATGKTLDTGTKETRVYVFTWVNKVADFEMESAPSPATESIDVYADQDVTLSAFPAIPAGYAATNRRVYRSVDGTYLFVKEFGMVATTFLDDLEADDLGEELPSMDWSMPPADLKGLVNLPNGIMAGFVGRDIYFSEPYRPYAWPETYIQTVDYPIVGLGVLDTTLVVLTKGTPYFVQGSHPDSMVVVKTDIEQACLSKRSIVAIAGGVVYASPDGLVSVSPGGSKIITADLVTRDQWQYNVAPWSVHAFEHDLKYHAFYDTGAKQGGFIMDFATGSLTMHDIYAECGFSELKTDKLFVANGAAVTRWAQGDALTFTWRSKRFTFPHYIMFSSAQVEAEEYPLTVRVYANRILIHEQEVAGRWVFRLPCNEGGRDWEVEIEANTEVFNFAVAQSMEEMAGV
jgi:hypothetical protein